MTKKKVVVGCPKLIKPKLSGQYLVEERDESLDKLPLFRGKRSKIAFEIAQDIKLLTSTQVLTLGSEEEFSKQWGSFKAGKANLYTHLKNFGIKRPVIIQHKGFVKVWDREFKGSRSVAEKVDAYHCKVNWDRQLMLTMQGDYTSNGLMPILSRQILARPPKRKRVDMSELIKIGDEFSWDTVCGKRYEGIIVDIDSNVAYVKCTDGVVRPVEI